MLLNIEIADFYATGPEITFRFGVTLAQDLTYTIGWLIFGLGLLTAGIYLHHRVGRMTAVALIAVTTFKAFLYDMGSLGGLYRVGVARRPGGLALAGRAGAAEVRPAVAARKPHENRSDSARGVAGASCRRAAPAATGDRAAAGVPARLPLRAADRRHGPGPRRLAIDVPLLAGVNSANLGDLRLFDANGARDRVPARVQAAGRADLEAGDDSAGRSGRSRQTEDERIRSRSRRDR